MTAAELAAVLVNRDPASLAGALLAADTGSGAHDALRGEALRRQGDAAHALPFLRSALIAYPDVVPLRHALAMALVATDDPAAACKQWEALLQRAPQAGAAWFNLGLARSTLGQTDAALEAFLEAHALVPQDVRPLLRAARLLGERADLIQAIALLSRAIELAPGNAAAWFERAAHRSSLALHHDAIADLRAALALRPDSAAGHSALLLEMHYDERLADPRAMRAAHDDWARVHAAVPRLRLPARSPRSRIRVGYLSPRFGDAPIATLLLPVLEAHDREHFDIVCYSAHPARGNVYERVRRSVDQWRDLPPGDDQAAHMIASDDCDLLVDLAGHAPGNRLGVLARKPARVQASWLDYFDTTGVDAVDFLIGDPIHTPPDHRERFSERLVLLPHARFAYRPPMPIEATPSPAAATGHVTFVSFNRHAKITDAVIDTWAAILRAVPDARLLLRASAYRSVASVEWVKQRWAARGVPIERVDFQPFVALEALHAAYAQADIALDPFPFNGGVTTCDALAHGVPVVTLRGASLVARQGAALIAAANCAQWIASDIDDYVRIACALARSAQLGPQRARLAADFKASPLADVAAFTRALERAYVAMIDADSQERTPLCIAASRATPGR